MAVYDSVVGETDITAERRECEEREIRASSGDVTGIDDNSGKLRRTKRIKDGMRHRTEAAYWREHTDVSSVRQAVNLMRRIPKEGEERRIICLHGAI